MLDQFAFSWTLPFSRTPGPERLVTVGTQESAVVPLIAPGHYYVIDGHRRLSAGRPVI